MTRRDVVFSAQAGVSIVLLAVLFHDFEWSAFQQVFTRIPLWFYLASFATVLAGQLLYAYRWRLFLVALGVPIPFRVVAEQYLVGIFFNNFLPSTMGGDWAKVYYLGRTEGYIRIGASVLIDRIVGVFVLASLALALTWAVAGPPQALAATRGVLVLLWFPLAAIVAAAIWLPVSTWSHWLSARLSRFERAIDRVSRLLEHMREATRQPAVLGGTSAVVVAYFVMLGIMYREFIAMNIGSAPGLLPVIALVATIATLSNVPVAINGLGLREQLHFALLATFGLSKEAAAGISLLLFGHMLVVSAVGAMLWVRGQTGRPGAGLTDAIPRRPA